MELVAFCRSYFTAKVKIATLSKVVPCSRVGHIFRSWSPYPWRTGNLMTKIISGLTTISMNDDLNLKCIFSSSDILFSDINVLTYNPLRVAEVWMDDYRYLQSCNAGCISFCLIKSGSSWEQIFCLGFLTSLLMNPNLQILVLRPVRALGQAALRSSRALWRRFGEASSPGEAAVSLFPMVLLLSINMSFHRNSVIQNLFMGVFCVLNFYHGKVQNLAS